MYLTFGGSKHDDRRRAALLAPTCQHADIKPETRLPGYPKNMVFEFQFKADDQDWQLIGRAATPGERIDLDAAAVALRDLREGHLPAGAYRIRAGDVDEGPWWPAEVDENGVFRRLEP